jgi:hypothetical protein
MKKITLWVMAALMLLLIPASCYAISGNAQVVRDYFKKMGFILEGSKEQGSDMVVETYNFVDQGKTTAQVLAKMDKKRDEVVRITMVFSKTLPDQKKEMTFFYSFACLVYTAALPDKLPPPETTAKEGRKLWVKVTQAWTLDKKEGKTPFFFNNFEVEVSSSPAEDTLTIGLPGR